MKEPINPQNILQVGLGFWTPPTPEWPPCQKLEISPVQPVARFSHA